MITAECSPTNELQVKQTMRQRRISNTRFCFFQTVVIVVFGISWVVAPLSIQGKLVQALVGNVPRSGIDVSRQKPLWIEPLYDDPRVVSDEELAAVLRQVRPKFPSDRLKPNHVEHALRTWGVAAEFRDSQAMSGAELRDFLLDDSRFHTSWGGRNRSASRCSHRRRLHSMGDGTMCLGASRSSSCLFDRGGSCIGTAGLRFRRSCTHRLGLVAQISARLSA